MTSAQTVERAIADSLSAVAKLSLEKVPADATIASLGLDSLTLSELAMDLEGRLSIQFDEPALQRLNEARTLQELRLVALEMFTGAGR